MAEQGLPKTTIVGLPDAAVKESIERVRSAMVNRGYAFAMSRLPAAPNCQFRHYIR
ncbi:MAG: magnesium chelatase domain-containing protein [Phycisphaeraceae bacterium]